MLAVEPEIIERYVRAGRVKLVFRAVLNHQERSVRASEAAACAAQQDQFRQMHTLLFEEQNTIWSTSNEGLLDLMLGFGQQLEGLDQEVFATCLANRETLAALQASDAEQRSRGITQQPIFEIGEQRFIGLQAIETMAAAIDAELTP
ncbi:MAG: DsbA family protein [Chloroflexi bacterium AL-W]|nr:DsbA family protein [Chloroflexi bacterium AL-N1]NOK71125.1 DsbA family protein [Chloroflexi bacterium AL-N10]NOK78591.1 DsbA family protein [Chloroflexi bacterium AL-N5]NOK85887.1 DsbA family protein [Chloroflexi bacterium AL-W]NOK92862.1 DsbA family protein [Chloroflexi bacterium AL-N15]